MDDESEIAVRFTVAIMERLQLPTENETELADRYIE